MRYWILITRAKNDGFKSSAAGREITLDNVESSLKDIASGNINKSNF